jgi:hypothetical protein
LLTGFHLNPKLSEKQLTLVTFGQNKLITQIQSYILFVYSRMLSVFRPSFEVVKEGRIFLTEKMSWKYPSPYKSII